MTSGSVCMAYLRSIKANEQVHSLGETLLDCGRLVGMLVVCESVSIGVTLLGTFCAFSCLTTASKTALAQLNVRLIQCSKSVGFTDANWVGVKLL